MSVCSAGTSNDAASVNALRKDARAVGCVVNLNPDEEGAAVERLLKLKDTVLQAYAACIKRAVDLNADWIAERCASVLAPVSLIGASLYPVLFCRAFASLLNAHIALVQSNAWHLALPTVRPVFDAAFDALLTTQSKNGDLLCAAVSIVATAAEVGGLFAAAQVRLRLSLSRNSLSTCCW